MKEASELQWGQIKTLLILSFLVLDIYLLVQFTEKQAQADLSVLEYTESTIEDQLKTENITIPKLSNKEYKETFISVEPKLIINEELKDLKNLEDQDSEVIQNKLIISKINKPLNVSKGSSKETMNNLLANLTLYPEDYLFWEWNEDTNVLVYFQQKLYRPIYYNQNGLLLLFLNDKNEVTSVKMGFHTRVPLDSGVQVFAPTWNVEVNGESHYFVNAIEEFIFSSEHQIFLKEALINVQEKAELIKEEKLERKTFINELQEKINIIERSE